jgi:hypothetical protein
MDTTAAMDTTADVKHVDVPADVAAAVDALVAAAVIAAADHDDDSEMASVSASPAVAGNGMDTSEDIAVADMEQEGVQKKTMPDDAVVPPAVEVATAADTVTVEIPPVAAAAAAAAVVVASAGASSAIELEDYVMSPPAVDALSSQAKPAAVAPVEPVQRLAAATITDAAGGVPPSPVAASVAPVRTPVRTPVARTAANDEILVQRIVMNVWRARRADRVQAVLRDCMGLHCEFSERHAIRERARMLLGMEKVGSVLLANSTPRGNKVLKCLPNVVDCSSYSVRELRQLRADVLRCSEAQGGMYREFEDGHVMLFNVFDGFMGQLEEWNRQVVSLCTDREPSTLAHLKELKKLQSKLFPHIGCPAKALLTKRITAVNKWIPKEQAVLESKARYSELLALFLARLESCHFTTTEYSIHIAVEIRKTELMNQKYSVAISRQAGSNVFQSLLTEIESENVRVNLDLVQDIQAKIPRYCLCQCMWKEGVTMIGCDSCDDWFHEEHVGLTAGQSETIETFKCPRCCRAADPTEVFKFGELPGYHDASLADLAAQQLVAAEAKRDDVFSIPNQDVLKYLDHSPMIMAIKKLKEASENKARRAEGIKRKRGTAERKKQAAAVAAEAIVAASREKTDGLPANKKAKVNAEDDAATAAVPYITEAAAISVNASTTITAVDIGFDQVQVPEGIQLPLEFEFQEKPVSNEVPTGKVAAEDKTLPSKVHEAEATAESSSTTTQKRKHVDESTATSTGSAHKRFRANEEKNVEDVDTQSSQPEQQQQPVDVANELVSEVASEDIVDTVESIPVDVGIATAVIAAVEEDATADADVPVQAFGEAEEASTAAYSW